MMQRGFFGCKKESDSFVILKKDFGSPEELGQMFVNFINSKKNEDLNRIFKEISLIEGSKKITPALINRYFDFFNLMDSFSKDAFLKKRSFYFDRIRELTLMSNWQWGYVFNFDTEKLEVYAKTKINHLSQEYFVCAFDAKNIPVNFIDIVYAEEKNRRFELCDTSKNSGIFFTEEELKIPLPIYKDDELFESGIV